jgi:hypothetical protein
MPPFRPVNRVCVDTAGEIEDPQADTRLKQIEDRSRLAQLGFAVVKTPLQITLVKIRFPKLDGFARDSPELGHFEIPYARMKLRV